jgi:hypothetical protein
MAVVSATTNHLPCFILNYHPALAIYTLVEDDFLEEWTLATLGLWVLCPE